MTEDLITRWMTRQEAADHARVDPKTIDRWAREGKLRRYKATGHGTPRFKMSDVDAVMELDA